MSQNDNPKLVTRTYIGILNHVCSPYSAQLSCKIFVIIRNSSLVSVLILTIFYAVKWYKVEIKHISIVMARKVSKQFSAQNSFSWCKSCFSHLFMSACRAHICLVIYQHNKASCRESECLVLV